jgi:hypothetical protein
MRKFTAPTRGLLAAFSLFVVAGSILAVTASAQPGSQSHQRSRPLHVTKTCPPETAKGQIGSYCTVTSSNVPALKVGTKIFYMQARGETELDSDIILYTGPGKTATGHCRLVFATGLGECTLSGGTRTLDGIRARVDVSYLGGADFAWDGTYRLRED